MVGWAESSVRSSRTSTLETQLERLRADFIRCPPNVVRRTMARRRRPRAARSIVTLKLRRRGEHRYTKIGCRIEHCRQQVQAEAQRRGVANRIGVEWTFSGTQDSPRFGQGTCKCDDASGCWA